MLARASLRASIPRVSKGLSRGLASRPCWAPPAQYGLAGPHIINSRRKFSQSPLLKPSSPNVQVTSEELFRYTEGRWLVDDDLNQELRYVKFDVQELCLAAEKAMDNGAKVIRVDKLPSRNNRVLLLTMDDGKEIIAKIKCKIGGPLLLSTASEATTIFFLSNSTSISAPELYGFDVHLDDSPVGAEYILMEKLKGVPLSQQWDTMSGPDQMKIIDQVVQMEKELANIEFPGYGSLYPRHSLPEEVCSTYPLSPSIDPEGLFCIGATCHDFWWYVMEEDGSQPRITNPGPWKNIAEYADSVLQRQLALISNPHIAPTIQQSLERFDKSQTLAEYEDLLGKARSVIPILSQDQRVLDIVEPILRHSGLKLGNIYVSADDPTKIEGYTGWQSAEVLPLFEQNRILNFLPIPIYYTQGAHSYSRPDNFHTLSDEAQQSVLKDLQMASKAKYYELRRRMEIPKMNDPFEVDYDLWSLLQRAGLHSSGSLAPLRSLIYHLFENWSKLDLPGVCPFTISASEFERHEEQDAKFQAAREVEGVMHDKLSTDSTGWVASDQWDKMVKVNEELHEDFHQTVSEELGSQYAADVWPFPPGPK